jgi:hypothetical protein
MHDVVTQDDEVTDDQQAAAQSERAPVERSKPERQRVGASISEDHDQRDEVGELDQDQPRVLHHPGAQSLRRGDQQSRIDQDQHEDGDPMVDRLPGDGISLRFFSDCCLILFHHSSSKFTVNKPLTLAVIHDSLWRGRNRYRKPDPCPRCTRK